MLRIDYFKEYKSILAKLGYRHGIPTENQPILLSLLLDSVVVGIHTTVVDSIRSYCMPYSPSEIQYSYSTFPQGKFKNSEWGDILVVVNEYELDGTRKISIEEWMSNLQKGHIKDAEVSLESDNARVAQGYEHTSNSAITESQLIGDQSTSNNNQILVTFDMFKIFAAQIVKNKVFIGYSQGGCYFDGIEKREKVLLPYQNIYGPPLTFAILFYCILTLWEQIKWQRPQDT